MQSENLCLETIEGMGRETTRYRHPKTVKRIEREREQDQFSTIIKVLLQKKKKNNYKSYVTIVFITK